MQDAGHQNGPGGNPVNDDVPPCREYQMLDGQFRSAVADLRVISDGQQRLVEDVAISLGLRFAPSFQAVLEDVGKIFHRFGGEDEQSLKT